MRDIGNCFQSGDAIVITLPHFFIIENNVTEVHYLMLFHQDSKVTHVVE
jgi:hypothetical protein